MNNDKLLIIVVVLTIYLLCFKKSEGQELQMCEFNKEEIKNTVHQTIADMFQASVDSNGKFTKPLTIESGLVLIDPNQSKDPFTTSTWTDTKGRTPTLSIVDPKNNGGFTMDGSVQHLFQCRRKDGSDYNKCWYVDGTDHA